MGSLGSARGAPRNRCPYRDKTRFVPGADVLRITEGNMDGGIIASTRPARRGRRPWHVWKLFAREPGDLGFGLRMDTAGPQREGEEP